jgi:hypothetical protein
MEMGEYTVKERCGMYAGADATKGCYRQEMPLDLEDAGSGGGGGDTLRGADALLLYAQGALIAWIVHMCSRVYAVLGADAWVSEERGDALLHWGPRRGIVCSWKRVADCGGSGGGG